MTRPTPLQELPTGQILVGDVLDQLGRLPDDCIDTVLTSPAYYALRDYQVEGQLGQEATIAEWVTNLRAVMAEVARVLKPGGSIWLNVGDSYSRHLRQGALPKSLLLGPERLLVALADDGFRIRSKVTWVKSNPCPSSVRDRPSNVWEPLYLLTRDRHYFYDADLVRQPAISRRLEPSKVNQSTKYSVQGTKRPAWSGPLAGTNSGLAQMKARGLSAHPLGRNLTDAWQLPTASYRGAHFATFPEALVERPILATCPEQVCTSCGQPWRRSRIYQRLGSLAVRAVNRKSCPCPDRSWQPGVVLDPLIGAGTVAVVAERLNRRWVGIELNPTFVQLAQERLASNRRPP